MTSREKQLMPANVIIRRRRKGDDVDALTELIHRAYSELAAMGFRYHATWQDVATTRDRLAKGIPYVAVCDDRIVGTITLYVPPNVGGCDWYKRGDVASFGQFAVDPDLQRAGIGSRLLEAIEEATRRRGISNLALDTAEDAAHLIKLYERRGFSIVGTTDWEITNYRSVIMNKPLNSPSVV